MKSKRKSARKAAGTPITLLTKVEAVLSDVLDQLSSLEHTLEKSVRVLLSAAETSVTKAKGFVTPGPSAQTRRKVARKRARGGSRRRARVVARRA
jgi:hypothetical protein